MTDPEDTGKPTDSMSALKGMISFFTLFHLDITQRDMDSMDERFHLVPVVGMIFGLIAWAVVTAVCWMSLETGFGGGLMAGVLSLAAVYIGSKFLHFDGLTDFGDGMIVSGPPEKHVHALKDSLVGAGGIGVALTVVLITVCIFGSSPVSALLFAIPLTEVMVKLAQVVAAAFGKPGNGMAGRQVGNTGRGSILYALLISLGVGAVLFLMSTLSQDLLGLEAAVLMDYPFMFALSAAVAAVVGWIMSSIANRNFGMVNGDILGATNEISRPVILFALVLYLMF